MPIQAFLTDRALFDASRSYVNLEKLNLPCGYLDRDTIEYFVEPLEVEDLRDERLTILYRPEIDINAPDTTVVENSLDIITLGEHHIQEYPNETVTLSQYHDLDFLDFENDTLPVDSVAISPKKDLKLLIDSVKLTGDDKTAFDTMNTGEQQRLFNVIEYLTYGTITTDTLADINVVLASNPEYLGYVPNSVKLIDKTVVFLYSGINIHRFAPKQMTFQFIIGNFAVLFKVWFDKEAFRSQYNETTIINITPPFELSVLLDPSTLTDPIDSAILAKKWSDAIISPEMTTRDQTGMYLFDTRYIYRGKTYTITFSLIYRGRTPDAMQARNYIASYLLLSGVGTRALWEMILPDVFYHSAFALIPFWDNTTKLTNSDIYPSIIRMNEYSEKINSILAFIPRANDPYREIMTAAYDKFFIGVAPIDVNEESSLLALYPTYRDFSSIDSGWSEMTEQVRNWSVKLNQALAVASGETNNLTMSLVTSGGLVWINYVLDLVSIFVLTKESYYKHFNLEV